MSERVTAARRALVDAPAHLVVEHLEAVLRERFGIDRAELYLVDYRLSVLLPLRGGDPVDRAGDPIWQAFDHQAEVIDESAGYLLPVTVRGDPLGVWRLRPVPPDPADRAELAEIGTLLAHELVTARASTDRYAIAARTRRLTLAAEMQWELLPGRSRVRPAFSLAGQLEPAYAVRGDSYDWAEAADRLTVVAINGMGDGVAAATLSSLVTNALRNARRAELSLADQAALADQAVYAAHRGAVHVGALLLELDLTTGRLVAVDAGSPQLVVLRGDELIEQELTAQFPLGMFDSTPYQEQEFSLEIGDRLFILSDGVTEATGTGRYGDAALHRFLRRTRTMSPLAAVRSLLGDLRAFVGSDLIDDAVVVCVDWTGVPDLGPAAT